MTIRMFDCQVGGNLWLVRISRGRTDGIHFEVALCEKALQPHPGD